MDLAGWTVGDVGRYDFPTVKIHSDHRVLRAETRPNTHCVSPESPIVIVRKLFDW